MVLSGEIGRSEPHYKRRYRATLETREHNHLRVCRILSCFSALGFRRYKAPLVSFIEREAGFAPFDAAAEDQNRRLPQTAGPFPLRISARAVNMFRTYLREDTPEYLRHSGVQPGDESDHVLFTSGVLRDGASGAAAVGAASVEGKGDGDDGADTEKESDDDDGDGAAAQSSSVNDANAAQARAIHAAAVAAAADADTEPESDGNENMIDNEDSDATEAFDPASQQRDAASSIVDEPVSTPVPGEAADAPGEADTTEVAANADVIQGDVHSVGTADVAVDAHASVLDAPTSQPDRMGMLCMPFVTLPCWCMYLRWRCCVALQVRAVGVVMLMPMLMLMLHRHPQATTQRCESCTMMLPPV